METAMLKVVGDILLALGSGDLAMLALLDLLAAFDSVNHAPLLQRMNVSYEIGVPIFNCFMSYLSNRM